MPRHVSRFAPIAVACNDSSWTDRSHGRQGSNRSDAKRSKTPAKNAFGQRLHAIKWLGKHRQNSRSPLYCRH
jgi:hypothetical protein